MRIYYTHFIEQQSSFFSDGTFWMFLILLTEQLPMKSFTSTDFLWMGLFNFTHKGPHACVCLLIKHTLSYQWCHTIAMICRWWQKGRRQLLAREHWCKQCWIQIPWNYKCFMWKEMHSTSLLELKDPHNLCCRVRLNVKNTLWGTFNILFTNLHYPFFLESVSVFTRTDIFFTWSLNMFLEASNCVHHELLP